MAKLRSRALNEKLEAAVLTEAMESSALIVGAMVDVENTLYEARE
jgi:hypothetical protein